MGGIAVNLPLVFALSTSHCLVGHEASVSPPLLAKRSAVQVHAMHATPTTLHIGPCVCDFCRGAILPSLHRMLRQINRLVPVCRSLASLEASASSSFSRAFADEANLQKTVLYDLHVANGGAPIALWPSSSRRSSPWALMGTG